ncbi:LOW QUALITY PROTEIN: U-box domain-containing protein 30-like [Asparagus officinalis]|nr:LOW QUALITY PROTEIN: U-box domain-containing protein 30-like [Asparagus officinalis]
MKLDTATQVIDVETAVKDGIFGGGGGGGGAPVVRSPPANKVDLKKMIEELDSAEEDIPTVFICPISLEPMLDPVTLCTGQTYERSNILKWFSLGHLTCPTTMQELWDDAVTPNSTLAPFDTAWFSQPLTSRFKKRAEDSSGRASELLDSLKRVKGQLRVQTLKDLNKLVIAHPSVKKTLATSNGIAVISSLLGPFTSHAVGSEAVAILVNLDIDSDSKANLMQPAKISLVTDMLNEGTIETKVNCTKFIDVLMGDKNFRSEIVSSMSLLVGILRLVKDRRYPNGVLAGLDLLKKICSHEQVRTLIVSVGAVSQIVEQLVHLNSECLELALRILDDISGIPEGRIALKDCPQTIPNMVRLLMRVSENCTQFSLSILWAVCKLAPDECAPVAVEAGLAPKLLLVIQSGCSPELKQRSAELLKLCSLNYTATIFMSKCKLTRTIQ